MSIYVLIAIAAVIILGAIFTKSRGTKDEKLCRKCGQKYAAPIHRVDSIDEAIRKAAHVFVPGRRYTGGVLSGGKGRTPDEPPPRKE